MKKILPVLLLIIVSMFCLNFATDPHKGETKKDITEDTTQYTVHVNFEYGESLASPNNIYVIWMGDSASGFIQNMKVCYKLTHGGLTNTALPYWNVNIRPSSPAGEVDAVTSPTIQNADFTVSAVLNDSTVRRFVVYFEVDRSFDANDWFSNQPALLYKVDIDLDNLQPFYELVAFGWTPNEGTENIIPDTPMGVLQNEIRYITHHKDGNTFGTPDTSNSSTKMVERITVTVDRPIISHSENIEKNNFSISLYPNPTNRQVNIKSNEIIDEIEIYNVQGQTILCVQPKTRETTCIIDRVITPTGLYYAKISTSKGICIRKIIVTE